MQDWTSHLHSRLDVWRDQGLLRDLKLASGPGVWFELNGQRVLSFASNDYLGLAAHPKVVAAASAALLQSGAGASASPLICGRKSEHAALERELADFKGTQSALVFPSGYQAAVATLAALATRENTLILDRLAHASLLDGARLSGARVRTFKHNDSADLARLLKCEQGRRCMVVVESFYSMDGDTAPLDNLVTLSAAEGALLMVDEAHATGVLGDTGKGALERFTVLNGALPGHVVAMGTLSKALGSQGGFICASQTVIDTIVHAGRAYLFSTALAPSAAAAASAALKLIAAEPERRRHLLKLSGALRQNLKDLNLNVPCGEFASPIVPIIAGEEQRATSWSNELMRCGIYVPAIRFPTVKKGQARLRVSLSAEHSKEDCEKLIKALKEIATSSFSIRQ